MKTAAKKPPKKKNTSTAKKDPAANVVQPPVAIINGRSARLGTYPNLIKYSWPMMTQKMERDRIPWNIFKLSSFDSYLTSRFVNLSRFSEKENNLKN